MANPRQRRKSRSSSYKPVSHSRHAKRNLKKTPPIRGPKVLQEAWDKQKTVRQNYARLGLVVTLDPSAHGGTENPLDQPASTSQGGTSTSFDVQKRNIPNGFGKILRDDTGNILGFDLNEDEEQGVNLGSEDIEDLDSRIDSKVLQKWAKSLYTGVSTSGNNDRSVIQELEQISASVTSTTTLSLPLSGVGSRHVSSGEVKYLESLVRTHGGKVEAMAGDLKLNPEQRTVGQLRRALRKAGLI